MRIDDEVVSRRGGDRRRSRPRMYRYVTYR